VRRSRGVLKSPNMLAEVAGLHFCAVAWNIVHTSLSELAKRFCMCMNDLTPYIEVSSKVPRIPPPTPQKMYDHIKILGATNRCTVGPKMLGATMQNLVAQAACLQGSVL